jgi:hypothetical protein
MKFSINEVTGVQQATFSAKLLSISDVTKTNANGKNYKIATIEFNDVNEEKQRATAICYEGNYSKGMENGKSYLATASQTDSGAIIQLSHLQNADAPTASMFGFEGAVEGKVIVAAKEEAKQTF